MKRKMLKPYWTTADGQQIAYDELSDDHLKNIIKDGYRNAYIKKEAKRRKFTVPERPIDKLSLIRLFMYVEAFASCAIEGNKLAIYMIGLWRNDVNAFYLELNMYLNNIETN